MLHYVRKLWLIAFLLLAGKAALGISPDSNYVFDRNAQTAVIERGARLLQKVKEENRILSASGHPERMNFVINLGLDTSADYLSDIALNGNRGYLHSADFGKILNSKLR